MSAPGPSEVCRGIAMALRDLLRAGREMREAMGARLGVGETDLVAMDHIAREPSHLGPVELGRRLGITSASATVLDFLTRATVVLREYATDPGTAGAG